MGIAVVALICLLGIAVCAKSLSVLGREAPWTSAGWALTVLYFIVILVKVKRVPEPAVLEYAALAALAIAFIVAGIRDERQAEPWWWPTRRGMTRAERATPIAPSKKRSPYE